MPQLLPTRPTPARRLAAQALGVLIPLLCAASPPDRSAANERPDPATVERYGPAYRYPRAGWIVLHVEGSPYERGYQHGRLLAPEIADYIDTLATKRSPKAPADAWRANRVHADVLFLRRFDKEFLEEMKGMADGAAAAGAKFDGRALDLLDLVAVNAEIELDFLEDAMPATPTGLEGKTFREPPDVRATPAPPEHCSAFAANGPATADGKVVIGHITMFSLYFVRHFNVWLDVKPETGHRVLMQTYPGGIQSGMDYYMNDAGLVVAETTLKQTKFDINGQTLASRIRKALQYSDSIDQVVETLKTGNNGLYTNEWLLADTKTNEIAMFELGTHKSKLWRSSKDEWFAGTKGFYWGCNNAKDLDVRLETVPGVDGRPANVVFHPSDRDRTWLKLYDKSKGKISADFGFEAFTTPPLSAFQSLDAKFTTSDMAKDMKTWALFGPPLGKTWDPSEAERKRYPDARPLVSNDWTVLTTEPPPSAVKPSAVARVGATEPSRTGPPPLASAAGSPHLGTDRARANPLGKDYELKFAAVERLVEPFPDAEKAAAPSTTRPAVDLGTSPSNDRDDDEVEPIHPPAWHGTLLPGADADAWLAAGFADYERIVARELAADARAKGKGKAVPKADRDALAVALFAPYSRYRCAVERSGRAVPLSETRSSYTDDDWYQAAAGKGVLLLQALRGRLGDEAFLALMDGFGRANAGKPASSAAFVKAVSTTSKGSTFAAHFFDAWLTKADLLSAQTRNFWSVDSFEAELDQAVIVYGTVKEAAAQREAATRLQRQIERKWSNIALPILSDREASPGQLKGKHVLLVGRPDSNALAADLAAKLPVKFGRASFVLRGDTYAHPSSAVVVAAERPDDPRHEVVLFAGLSAEATWRCVQAVGARDGAPATVILLPSGRPARRLAVGRDAEPRD